MKYELDYIDGNVIRGKNHYYFLLKYGGLQSLKDIDSTLKSFNLELKVSQSAYDFLTLSESACDESKTSVPFSDLLNNHLFELAYSSNALDGKTVSSTLALQYGVACLLQANDTNIFDPETNRFFKLEDRYKNLDSFGKYVERMCYKFDFEANRQLIKEELKSLDQFYRPFQVALQLYTLGNILIGDLGFAFGYKHSALEKIFNSDSITHLTAADMYHDDEHLSSIDDPHKWIQDLNIFFGNLESVFKRSEGPLISPEAGLTLPGAFNLRFHDENFHLPKVGLLKPTDWRKRLILSE